MIGKLTSGSNLFSEVFLTRSERHCYQGIMYHRRSHRGFRLEWYRKNSPSVSQSRARFGRLRFGAPSTQREHSVLMRVTGVIRRVETFNFDPIFLSISTNDFIVIRHWRWLYCKPKRLSWLCCLYFKCICCLQLYIHYLKKNIFKPLILGEKSS